MLKVTSGIEVELHRGEHSLGRGECRRVREAEGNSEDQFQIEDIKRV